jgi:hypothetical protein
MLFFEGMNDKCFVVQNNKPKQGFNQDPNWYFAENFAFEVRVAPTWHCSWASCQTKPNQTVQFRFISRKLGPDRPVMKFTTYFAISEADFFWR